MKNKISDMIRKIQAELSMKKYELAFNFIAMILGVLIGFQIESCRQNHSLNSNSNTRLHLLFLESEYNLVCGQSLYDCYKNIDSSAISVKMLESSAAEMVLEDENIYNILPYHKVSLIKSYLDALHTINKSNEICINYSASINFIVTPNMKIIKKSLSNDIASFLAIAYELQQQFQHHFNHEVYDDKEIENSEQHIKSNKSKILNNQFRMGKGNNK